MLARDASGSLFDIEIQVRRHAAWYQRGLFYLARNLSLQLQAGEDYRSLPATVGIHLLDFDLFTETPAQRDQALWRFEMRDATQPTVCLGDLLQMNLVELKKADRLQQLPEVTSAWVTFFEPSQEEARMAEIKHAPVKDAMSRIRDLSADEMAFRRALVRERALRDEVSFLSEARDEGREEGRQEGRKEGRQEGRREGLQEGLEQGHRQAEIELLTRVIERKFGVVPGWAHARLQSASSEQLLLWVDRVLTAESVEALLAE